MKPKPTLKYLAEQLNLSTSTVSKALKDSDEISAKTIERVKALAKMLDYRPNTAAASLRNRETKTIAVIVPDIINDFFAQALMGIEQAASEKGYRVVTCISNESLEKEKSYCSMFSNGAVDGFIIAASGETQQANDYRHLQSVMDAGLSLVMFDRVIDDLECEKIVVDDLNSAMNIVDFLVAKGDKNIAMVSEINDLSVGQLRGRGISSRINELPGVNYHPIIASNDEELATQLEHHMSTGIVDAMITVDHKSGMIALQKLHELGVNVPKDLQIICYSNSVMAQYSYPRLSVVDQHAKEIGEKSFERMLGLLKSSGVEKPVEITTVKTTLLERGTTRK